MKNYKSDVLVVGAGPTGAHFAGLVAEAGLSVILIDRQPKGEAGAQWINGAPEWMYLAAGLESPPAEEIFSRDHIFTILDPSSRTRISLKDLSLFDIDMSYLGKRLVNKAAAAHVDLHFDTTVSSLELDSATRPARAYAFATNKQSTQYSFESRLFVDASGLSAVIRKNIPSLNQACAPLEREDLCNAAQEIRE